MWVALPSSFCSHLVLFHCPHLLFVRAPLTLISALVRSLDPRLAWPRGKLCGWWWRKGQRLQFCSWRCFMLTPLLMNAWQHVCVFCRLWKRTLHLLRLHCLLQTWVLHFFKFYLGKLDKVSLLPIVVTIKRGGTDNVLQIEPQGRIVWFVWFFSSRNKTKASWSGTILSCTFRKHCITFLALCLTFQKDKPNYMQSVGSFLRLAKLQQKYQKVACFFFSKRKTPNVIFWEPSSGRFEESHIYLMFRFLH